MKCFELKYYFSICMLVFMTGICVDGYAQPNPWEQAGHKFLQSAPLESSFVGFQLIDLQDKKVLAEKQAEKLFVPASILKSWYNLAAIDQLGTDYHFITRIKTNGQLLADGSLEGDLIIEASGDPSLASDRFERKYDLDHFLNAFYVLLKKNGIHCIDGQLILQVQDSGPALSGDWLWEDIANYYGGGAWGFNFNENSFEASFLIPSKAGKRTRLQRIQPSIPFMTLQNEVMSGKKSSGDQAYFYGGPNDYHKEIRGTLGAGLGQYSIRGAIPNPPLSFLHILHRYLESKGIYVTEIRLTDQPQPSVQVLGTYQSPDLIDLAGKCMDYSINLYSEAFGKLLLAHHGRSSRKNYPSKEDWEAIFTPYSLTDEFVLSDACGLSHSNLLSPHVMNAFLIKMIDRLGFEVLQEVFPKNGKDGHARDFITTGDYPVKLWLKSGSISGVLNYTGFFQSPKDQKYYLFTIMTNHNRYSTKRVKAEIKKLLREWMKIES